MEENSDKDKPDYVSYKKVLIFGAQSSGKSSFSERLKNGKFKENLQHTEECKLNLKL